MTPPTARRCITARGGRALVAIVLGLAACNGDGALAGVPVDLAVPTGDLLCEVPCGTCSAGEVCVHWYVSGPHEHCLRTCTLDSDCPSGAACVQFGGIESPTPADGRYCYGGALPQCDSQSCEVAPGFPAQWCADGGYLERVWQAGGHCGTEFVQCKNGPCVTDPSDGGDPSGPPGHCP